MTIPAWVIQRDETVRAMVRKAVLDQTGAGEGDVAIALNSIAYEDDAQTARDGTRRVAFLMRGTTTLLTDRNLVAFRVRPATEPAA